MLRLARPLLTLVAPALVLGACGDNIVGPGDADEAVIDTEPDHEHGQEPPTTPRAIAVFLELTAPSCDAPAVAFEVIATYIDDGSPVPTPTCRVDFDDGAVFPRCTGTHVFSAAGIHGATAEVFDPATGAAAIVNVERDVPPGLEVELEASAPACGLELSFAGSVNVGAFTVVQISPAANVLGPDGYHLTRANTVTVSAPGTYQVTMTAEDERPSGPICLAEVTRTVEVVACPPDDDHDHCGCARCPH